eukprot:SAG31_NODE_28323_length_411_cov_4.512821_1_plen_27_part_10
MISRVIHVFKVVLLPVLLPKELTTDAN